MAGKKGTTISFEEGSLIFAKVKGYPAWPARVTKTLDAKGNRFEVLFFGTYETAKLNKAEMHPYDEETKAKFGHQKRPKKGFEQALYEIENTPGLMTQEMYPEIPLDESAVPLEGGISGDTTVEESLLEQSSIAESPAPLVIAEPKPNTSAAKKTGVKRKAEQSPATPTPAKRVNKVAGAKSSHPKALPVLNTPTISIPTSSSTPSTPASDKTSRSGRLIKPKKYEDADNSDKLTIDEPLTPKSITFGSAKKTDVNRKVWVQFKATGDTIEINPDKSKPQNLSKEEEIEWERSASKNVLKFKNLVETGQLIPSEIRQKLEAKTHRTPQEEEILRNEKILCNKREKVRFLMVEQKITDLDIALKMALHHEKPDLKRCITISEEVQKLAIVPLMLKKHPEIVATIRRMRKYVGPREAHPNPKEQKEIEAQAEKIRMEAEVIYKKLAALFNSPEDVNFGMFFKEELKTFVDATKDMPQDKLMQMVDEC